MRNSEHMNWRRQTGVVAVVVSMLLALLALTPPASAGAAPARYPLSVFAGDGSYGAPTAGVATSSALKTPSGVAVDSNNNVYIADAANNRIEKVTPEGVLSVFAGTGTAGAPTAGAATSSRLSGPSGVAVDSNNNVYIADTDNYRVEKVTPEGVLSIFAGNGSYGAPTAGVATSSALKTPSGVAVDSAGNVYIADGYAHRVEKVTPEGVLSIFAGTGTAGTPTAGAATSSRLNEPSGVAVDSSGNVYIADFANDLVEKVTSDGTLSVFAGTGSNGARPSAGAATSANLDGPSGLAVDSSNNVYIADRYNNMIEKVTPAGVLSVFAGTGSSGTPTAGAATSSKLSGPRGVAVGSSGNVYIADTNNTMIEKINVGSTISVPGAPTSPVATTTSYSSQGGSASVSFTAPDSNGGSPIVTYRVTATDITNAGRGGQTATGATSPVSIGGLTVGDTYTFTVAATNGDANYYGTESTASGSHVALAPTRGDGKLLLVAGTPGTSGYSAPGAALATSLSYPAGVAVGSDGTVYINVRGSGFTTSLIYKLGSDGMLTLFAGNDSGSCPTGAGSALSVGFQNNGTAVTMAVDSHGNLYVPIPTACHMVVKITPAGALSIVAGTGVSGAPTEGTATSSKLSVPKGVAVDSADNVYITDSSNRVVKVTAAGQLSFFAGTGVSGTATAGAASSSKLNGPTGIAVDSADNVYIADSGNYRVEKVTPAGQLSFYAGTGVSGASTEGAATSSRLGQPTGLAIDPSGNLFIGDDYYASYRVEKVTPAGQLSFYAGNGSGGDSTFGSSATSTPVEHPASLAAASNGDLYMVEFYKGVVAMVMGAPASVPAAPTSLVATPGNGSASIAFTAGANGGASITNYKYSIDDGANWTTRSPSATTSPLVITGLTNGTTYNIKLRAVNSAGDGTESSAVSVTPRTTPDAPTTLVATPGNGSVSIAFTPGATGGNAITKYQYRIGSGAWLDAPAGTTSPVVITGLVNYVTNSIKLRAYNAIGGGTESSPVSVTVKISAPVITSVYSGNISGVAARGIIVGFTGVKSPGATMVSYRINAYAKGTNTVVSTVLVRAGDRAAFLGGLTKGVEYDVRVVGYLTLSGSPLLTRGTYESAATTVKV